MSELRKIFLSCDYRHDGEYSDKFLEMNRYWNIFSRVYIRDDVSTHLTSDRESVLKDIRVNHIRDSTVLVLLCGKGTRYCPYVDREVCSAMTNNYTYSKLGILVIALPESGNQECLCKEDYALLHRDGKYSIPSTTYELSAILPGVPMRIIDSIRRGCPISVITWKQAAEDHDRLVELIDRAHRRRSTNRYDNKGQMKE